MEMAIKNGMAVRNPDFDPNVPYSEAILWTEEGLARLASMDETDVRDDQSKRHRSAAERSVVLHEPASRCGHRKGVAGRKGSAETAQKRGFVSKQAAAQRPKDDGQVLSKKSARKISFAGGTLGNGECFAPMIISDQSYTADELRAGPRGTVRVVDQDQSSPTYGQVIPQRAEYVVNASGGMESDDYLTYLDKIVIPGTQVKPDRRGILCADGLQQHHSFKAIIKAKDAGLDVALRFPHGSSRTVECMLPSRALCINSNPTQP